MIECYTDGSCVKNNHGGWCSVLKFDSLLIVLGGYQPDTTNNRMELTALIETVQFAKQYHIPRLKIYSDSLYVINGATGINKLNVNLDLWDIYFDLDYSGHLEFEWVKGHSDNKYNNIADQIARSYAEKKLL